MKLDINDKTLILDYPKKYYLELKLPFIVN